MNDESDIMPELTARQAQILNSIIEEFINTAEAVGSDTLEKKYNIGVSPATIRNEMVALTELGILNQPHTSSGRTPTPKAMKYYIQHLMKPRDLTVAEEVAVKTRVWDYRQEIDKLLRESTRALAEKTHALALSITNEGDIYYAGAVNILDMPEFFDYELTHDLFSNLDEYNFWWDILEKRQDPFDVLLGDEVCSQTKMSQCGFVYSKFKTPGGKGAIGVVGPSRLDYPAIIPTVKYLGSLIDDFLRHI